MDDHNFDKPTAQIWIETIESSTSTYRKEYIYPLINDLILRFKPRKILDIGCGQGMSANQIALDQTIYTGVEPSPFLLARAKELYSNFNREFLEGNAYGLPVKDASFEVVFSLMVWHLLEDINKAAKELSRVLANAGEFLIVTANPLAINCWKDFYPDASIIGKKLEGTMQIKDLKSKDTIYFHTVYDLEHSFHREGLQILKIENFLPAKGSESMQMLTILHGNKQK